MTRKHFRHSDDPAKNAATEGNAPIDERVLVGRCLRPEIEGLQTLVLHYSDAVWAGAARAIGRHAGRLSCDTTDLVQDFFVELYADPGKLLGRFDASRGSLRSWLEGVAFRCCSKMLRSHALTWPPRTNEDAAIDLTALPQRSSKRMHAADMLDRIMNCPKLSPTARYILRARLAGKSAREIAAELGITVQAVYRQIYGIRKVWPPLDGD